MVGARGVGSAYGGIERVVGEISKRLAARGHEVDIYCRRALTGESHANPRLIGIPAWPGKHTETLSRAALSTITAVGAGYDVIHFHALGPAILTPVAALLKQRTVVTVHGLDWNREKWGRAAKLALRVAEKTMVRHSDAITVVSRSLRDYFRTRYGLTAEFVPNGLPTAKPRPLTAHLYSLGISSREYVLFASRLVPEKACGELIEAFNGISTPKKLVVAGIGERRYVAHLRQLARKGKVIFTGHLEGEELAALFSNAYFFVLPSHIEGMSNALLEALAHGRAALISNIAENMDITENFARTFAVGDKCDLAAKLAEFLASGALVRRYEDAARQAKALLPDWDRCTDAYESVYRQVVHAPGTSSDAVESGLLNLYAGSKPHAAAEPDRLNRP